MPIKELTIKGIRGIRSEITIPFNGQSLLLHGENGTGKSSIERAMRWALLGTEIPTDEDAFSSESSFRRHILEPSDSPEVKITLADSSQIKLTTNSKETSGTGDVFRNACIKGNPFLRRAEILDFLNQRPRDRFAYIESFLDLAVIDEIYTKYKHEYERCENAYSRKQSELNSKLNPLSARLPEDFRTQRFIWEDFKVSCIQYAISLSILEAKEDIGWEDLLNSGKKAKELSEGNKLEVLRAKLTNMLRVVNSFVERFPMGDLPLVDELNQSCEGLKKSSIDASISELLIHAQKHFSAAEPANCPICNNTVNAEVILSSLSSRLETLRTYQEADKELKYAIDKWHELIIGFNSAFSEVLACYEIKQIDELDETLKFPKGFDLLEAVTRYSAKNNVLAQLLAIGTEEIKKYIEVFCARVSTRLSKELSKLPDTSMIADLRIFSSLIGEANGVLSDVQQLENENTVLARKCVILEKICEALRRSRQDVARSTMERISETVERFYQIIHPTDDQNEATGPPNLRIQRHGRGTAKIEGMFNGETVADPNWVYSDGHLDTVGICVFLALRRFRGNQANDSKLMVLDDVILSIDLPHARKLIFLLKDEFSDHQIFLLTHNGLFAHWCIRLLPGMRRLAINGWSLEKGPQIGDYRTAIAIVEEVLTDSSPKQIALQVMNLMDEWLAECRYVYNLSIPAKPGEQYTLTEIWNKFASTVKKIGRKLNSDFDGVFALLDALSDLPDVRNSLAAHENDFAKEFPRSTMVEIANNCLDLVRHLYCTECCSFVKPVPDRRNPVMMHCDENHIQFVIPKKD